jgi:hypothetical protein
MAFVTGSYAYGVPHSESDVDLVVLVTEADLLRLGKLADRERTLAAEAAAGGYGAAHATSLYFGDLNLICCTSRKAYDAWQKATQHLKKEATQQGGVTRDRAISCMSHFRREAGL